MRSNISPPTNVNIKDNTFQEIMLLLICNENATLEKSIYAPHYRVHTCSFSVHCFTKIWCLEIPKILSLSL